MNENNRLYFSHSVKRCSIECYRNEDPYYYSFDLRIKHNDETVFLAHISYRDMTEQYAKWMRDNDCTISAINVKLDKDRNVN